VERLLPYIDSYIVDVKETHLPVYRIYTRRSNRMVMGNLRWLARQGKADRVEVRLPLIPSFNNDEMRADSRRLLAGMGFTRFDEFIYIVPQPEGRAVAKMPEGNHK
jgi:pyruvate formate lyase activating enzyme